MILDFSKFSINEILKLDFQQYWQIEILHFLQKWNSENKNLDVKTSGSTGKPKVYNYPKSAFIQSAKMTGEFLHLQKGNSAFLCLPIQYIAGKMMVIRAITLQLKLYCIEPKSEIDFENEIDFCAMTPMQVEKSLQYIPKIKKLIIGGAQITTDLMDKLYPFSNEIYETFGMTETLSHVAMKRISMDNNVFELLPNITISKDDRNCLVIKTPYFEDEIITNDMVELTDNKHFIWKGRFDNVINSGGIKLFPEEIEQKLNPFIQNNFYVSSQKNTILGEELVLVIESKEAFFDKKIFELAQLTKFEIPKNIIFKNKFDYTENGKIIRKK